MSTKENEGRKRIYSDNPLEDMSVFDRMVEVSKQLDLMLAEFPTELAMTIVLENIHHRCHREGLYFPDFLESAVAVAEMIEHDSELWES